GADVDDRLAGAFVEAGEDPLALAPQHDVGAAAFARLAADRRLEARGLDAALRQSLGNQLALPASVDVAPPVLQRAAATGAEMRTGRRFAMTRRRQHFQQLARDAVATLVERLGLDRLGRQAVGHEVALAFEIGDA